MAFSALDPPDARSHFGGEEPVVGRFRRQLPDRAELDVDRRSSKARGLERCPVSLHGGLGKATGPVFGAPPRKGVERPLVGSFRMRGGHRV